MTERELYKELGVLTRQKERWEESVPYVVSVEPYVERLRSIAENDPNRVVRIHCEGAIKATKR